MTEAQSLIPRLRARGVRMTPQRAMIVQAIEEMPGHITADEVYQRVQRASPYVNLATVYRTLDLLAEMGFVTVSDMGTGAAHFVLHSHATHHHAVCRRCGRSIEFAPELLDTFMAAMVERYGFFTEANHIVIFGCCADCADEGESMPIDHPQLPA